MSKTKDINESLLVASLPKKTFSKFNKPFIELPNLVENQIASFKEYKIKIINNFYLL